MQRYHILTLAKKCLLGCCVSYWPGCHLRARCFDATCNAQCMDDIRMVSVILLSYSECGLACDACSTGAECSIFEMLRHIGIFSAF